MPPATTIITLTRCSMPTITDDLLAQQRLLRLLHLCSPSLPVGAYAYSQGLEGAVDLAWVSDAETLQEWLRQQLHHSLAHVELPLLLRCHAAAVTNDLAALEQWNALLLACRESAELRLGDTATGAALARLLPSFGLEPPVLRPPTLLALFAVAAVHWHISSQDCAAAYAWIWLENQVLAATKLMPLGQTQAQALLYGLQEEVMRSVARAQQLDDEEIGSSLTGLALASLHHETQYSRLFRS